MINLNSYFLNFELQLHYHELWHGTQLTIKMNHLLRDKKQLYFWIYLFVDKAVNWIQSRANQQGKTVITSFCTFYLVLSFLGFGFVIRNAKYYGNSFVFLCSLKIECISSTSALLIYKRLIAWKHHVDAHIYIFFTIF